MNSFSSLIGLLLVYFKFWNDFRAILKKSFFLTFSSLDLFWIAGFSASFSFPTFLAASRTQPSFMIGSLGLMTVRLLVFTPAKQNPEDFALPLPAYAVG